MVQVDCTPKVHMVLMSGAFCLVQMLTYGTFTVHCGCFVDKLSYCALKVSFLHYDTIHILTGYENLRVYITVYNYYFFNKNRTWICKPDLGITIKY